MLEDSDYEEEQPPISLNTRAKSSLKLIVILLSYALVFVTMVRFGFWTFEVRPPQKEYMPVWDCLSNGTSQQCNPKAIGMTMLFNMALIVLFGVQHTFMSQRKLILTKYWEIVHYEWEIDKAVYNFMTAITLQLLIGLWQPMDLWLWKIDLINNAPYSFHFVLHVISWAVFYGTNLMIDYPDLIGLNQVIIECRNKVVKSPELQTMIQNQRHMGIIPLIIILTVYPVMSLDRFLLTVTMLTYTYSSWRSQTCYPYARSMQRMKKSDLNGHVKYH